jgi:hypothetical protein
MASLYNLSIEFLQVAQQLEEMELDQETLADTLESLQIPIEEKAENVIKFAKNLEAMAEARKTEAKRLTEQAAKDAKKAERLLSYLDDAMRMLNKKKLTAGVFEVGYKKGLEVVKVDETRLPKEYWLPQKPKPMGKPELKKLVKDGVEIEGVTLERNPDKLTIK